MKIGFIGLGIMGYRMAANLQKEGFTLVVNNRSKEKAQGLIAGGALWADSPKEVGAQVEIIITMLSTPEVVENVALGDDGFLTGWKGLWIDCSTVNPSFSRQMAEKSAQMGVRFLDAPVAGTKKPAELGELVFFIGGQAEDVATAAPLFEAMGKKTIHMGNHGAGASIKMLINQLLGQSMAAFAEALTLGQAMGMEWETLWKVLLNVPVVPPYLANVRPMLEAENPPPNFPLQWMHKDLRLANQSARELGLELPFLYAAENLYDQARQSGLAEDDFSAIYQFTHDQGIKQ